MHILVPESILFNLSRRKLHGNFEATALRVDISGFTGLTESLMQHGRAGAEALARKVMEESLALWKKLQS